MISNSFIIIGLILFTYGAISLCITKNTNIHNYILLSKSIKGMKKYKKELLNNFMINFSNSNYTDMNEYNADTNKWTEYCKKEEEVQNSIEERKE